jgi:hypothetical protein
VSDRDNGCTSVSVDRDPIYSEIVIVAHVVIVSASVLVDVVVMRLRVRAASVNGKRVVNVVCVLISRRARVRRNVSCVCERKRVRASTNTARIQSAVHWRPANSRAWNRIIQLGKTKL